MVDRRDPALPSPPRQDRRLRQAIEATLATVGHALGCLCWTAALRLPLRGNIGEDEAFFAVVAQRWRLGGPPYAASFDVKPPGLFAAVALAQAVLGAPIAAVKALEIACIALSACGLFLIGSRHLSRPVGIGAALLYPLYTLTLSGANSAAELIEAPGEVFAALAVLEALRGGRARFACAAAAGLLLGLAATIRQNAVFPALTLLAVLLWRWPGSGRARLAAGYFGGLAVLPAGFALLYAARGQVHALVGGAVLGALGRMRGDDISFIGGLLRFLPSMRPLAVLLPGLVLILTRRGRWCATPLAAGCAVALAWLAGSAAGILAVRSMYDHYFLDLLAPLLLIAAIAPCHLFAAPVRPRLIAAVLAAAVWPFMVDRTAWRAGTDTQAAAAAATAIDRAGIPADATMLVANRDLLTYLDAHRQPADRYFHPQHLLCDFPAPDADPLTLALAAHPGVLVLADDTRRMVCTRADRYQELQAAIAAQYCRAAHVTGAEDSVDIFVDRRTYRAACAP